MVEKVASCFARKLISAQSPPSLKRKLVWYFSFCASEIASLTEATQQADCSHYAGQFQTFSLQLELSFSYSFVSFSFSYEELAAFQFVRFAWWHSSLDFRLLWLCHSLCSHVHKLAAQVCVSWKCEVDWKHFRAFPQKSGIPRPDLASRRFATLAHWSHTFFSGLYKSWDWHFELGPVDSADW